MLAAARWQLFAAELLVLAVVSSTSCHEITDPDALSRLSLGRYIWEHGPAATDPFTFAVRGAPWSDPEWLGDVGLYAVFSLGGERGLQLCIVACVIRAYEVLRTATDATAAVRGAAAKIAEAWPSLPQTEDLARALSEIRLKGYPQGE